MEIPNFLLEPFHYIFPSSVNWFMCSIFSNDNYDDCRKIFWDGCGDMLGLSEALIENQWTFDLFENKPNQQLSQTPINIQP